MRKILLLSVVLLIGMRSMADNVLQMVPLETKAGITGKKGVISIRLSNTDIVWAIEFNIYLPEGMSFYKKSGKYQINSVGRTLDEDDDELFDINSSYNETEKCYKILVYTLSDEIMINPGDGDILEIYYNTDNSLESGVYPILIKGTKLAGLNSVKLDTYAETSSYVVIDNDDNSNPLAKNAHVDLSGMTGYIPSFVVNQLNTDIASNKSLKSLNLSGTSFENLGAALNVPDNNDLLWYTSDKASLNRTFTAGNWSTVCLPFALETITVNTLLNNGCAVKGMTRYDSSEKTVTFDDVNTMSTGVPYLFKCSDLKTKPFENIDITNPEAISTGPHNVTYNNLTFKGTYELVEPSSTDSRTIYGYKKNQFVKVESYQSGKVQPFRAYMELAGVVGGTRGFISIDGLDDATGINEIVVPDAEKTTPIYDLQGRKVDGNYHSRGILIQNGKKIIKK